MYKMLENIAWRILEGEAVVLNVDSGRYYTLNPSSTLIWKRITEGDDVESVVAALCEEYEVEPKLARTDIMQQLDQWLESGLISET